MKNYLEKYVLKDKINNKGYVFLAAHGNSMFPTISDKDMVCLSKVENVAVGDVIGYFLNSEDNLDIVIHRVVLVRKTYVLAKGDSVSFFDLRKRKHLFWQLGIIGRKQRIRTTFFQN